MSYVSPVYLEKRNFPVRGIQQDLKWIFYKLNYWISSLTNEYEIFYTYIKHGSKQGNKFHTSFSYTRCSVQSRIWTLRRTAPSRTEVPGLNCSDHSTSLKKLASWRAMALLSDTDPDPTPRSALCCDSIVTGDFCSARRRSSQGSNPALHWAAGGRKTCMEFVFPLGSVLNIDCNYLHEIPTSSFCL